jgi:outer membrane lipoprotein-sorting protein
MPRRTLAVLAAAAALVFLTSARPASAQTADEIVEGHLAAVGGREALAKLTSRRSSGTVTIATAGAELSGSAEVDGKAPNKTRAVLHLDLSPLGAPGEMTVEQLFDGEKGYTLNSLQGDTEITGRQLENLRNNAFPTPLVNYRELGARLELLPKDTIAGRAVDVVKLTPKTGPPERICFDAETHLIARIVTELDSPAGGTMEQTSDLSDYRTVDGFKVAFKVVNTTDVQTVTLVLTKVEHNIPLDDATFVKRD